MTAVKNLFSVLVVVALSAAAIGWGMNIWKLVEMMGGAITAMFIGRLFGVFLAPLGAVLGYF